ncbi:MAG: ascorbate-dependent monooxygenase [Isosphaeraceae bacterium]|nr:ascorbate-dependent monooxygenase [Isosphaeraceae bacterium]
MSRITILSAAAGLIGLFSPRAFAAETPTFHRDVERILRKHCQDCHRPGQVAPFSLLTYEQAKKRAGDIASITEDRRMPPWHASTTVGGPFKEARVLSSEELATLSSWAEAGAPKGEVADAPPPPSFASDWPLGEPDLILTPSESYTLGASGDDEFRVFVMPSGLTEGKWVTAVDFKPGNRKVVHHILAGVDTTGRAARADQAEAGPGYQSFAGFGTDALGLPILPSGGLSGWAPGKAPLALPEGVGRYVPAGADVLLQVHYHKSGKPETDRTAIGLYFAKGKIDKQLRGGMVLPPRQRFSIRPELVIPAGAANHPIGGTMTLSYDAHLCAIVPHMHWLGKDFELTAVRPDGSRTTLIKIDRWDFNWQDTYEFVEPVALPKGTKIEMSAHFDNSEANPSNPSKPPLEVRWGEQTTNEMCIGFLQMTRDDEHLNGAAPPRRSSTFDFERGKATSKKSNPD